jgi:P27 family predicted phage terminase small subunit
VALLARAPRPPKHLGPLAAEIWRDMARQLVAAQMLSEGDLHALEDYCVTLERAREAEDVIRREGRVLVTPQGARRHPELVTAEKARADCRRIAAAFGLTPGDRPKVRLTAEGEKKSNEFAAFDKFLKGA